MKSLNPLAVLLAAAMLAGCAGTPPPDWQMNAKASLERANAAYLSGNARVEAAEMARARAEVASTGRPELMARVELLRCAARVASLDFDDCPAYAALAQDALPAERAYAAYLSGQITPQEAELLPAAQRAVASGSAGAAAALRETGEPLATLVAAGVLLRSGRADPTVLALAVETASAQGWRRPLLAWLKLQLRQAEAAGDAELAARLRRRLNLVLGPAGGS